MFLFTRLKPQIFESSLSMTATLHGVRVWDGFLGSCVGTCGKLPLYADEWPQRFALPLSAKSRHSTIEAAETSQFENHLRAICGLPLGRTSSTQTTEMVNLIGRLPVEEEIRNIPGTSLHFYGKIERLGRKVGHVTLTSSDYSPDEFELRLAALLNLVGEAELASQKFFNSTPLTQCP